MIWLTMEGFVPGDVEMVIALLNTFDFTMIEMNTHLHRAVIKFFIAFTKGANIPVNFMNFSARIFMNEL